MTTEFDRVFDQMEAPEYPATCDKCGYEATNAEIDQHICNDAPAVPERVDAINGDLFIQPLPNTTKFLLLTDADWPIAEVYTEAEAKQLRDEHNQHSTLIAQREQLLRAAQFALSTPGMIRGRDSLQRIVDEVLTTSEQKGTPQR